MLEQSDPRQAPSHHLAVAQPVEAHLAAVVEVLRWEVVGFLDVMRSPRFDSMNLQTLAVFHFHHPALALRRC